MGPSNERIHVVVTCHNAGSYLKRTIASIKSQTWRDFSVMVIDDASSDGTAECAREASRADERFLCRVLPERAWAARARELALDSLEARPEEIVVLVDGDDWLSSPEAFETLRRFHRERRLLAAYGNHVTSDGHRCRWSQDYPLSARITGTYRSVGWLVSHPRSFRYGLWQHVRRSALRDERGAYFRCATDMALFLPILELSGVRSAYLPAPLYVYNRETPLNVDKLDRAAQERAALAVLRQPPHAPLPRSLQEPLLG